MVALWRKQKAFNSGRLMRKSQPLLCLPMKTVSINLDEDRAAKLKAISESTAGHSADIYVAGQTFKVEQRKISASAIAVGLLNAAIDTAHAQL